MSNHLVFVVRNVEMEKFVTLLLPIQHLKVLHEKYNFLFYSIADTRTNIESRTKIGMGYMVLTTNILLKQKRYKHTS